mmetsp:Transcript_106087/g.342492  ORF Transcript_106087/g.342492 Transcript_106087/m.342492 type:complete len:237 (+) Transcript_106087:51-761(+)
MANVDVEGGFERLAQLWGLKQWKVEQEGEVVVSQTSQCEKSCVARIDFTHADLPYECKALVSRPEFMCEHTELFVTLNMEMIRMLSPGDAIVSMKYDAQLDRAVKMLVGQYSQELRFTLRRDFPHEGMTVALLAPPNPGGYMMLPHFTFLSYYIASDRDVRDRMGTKIQLLGDVRVGEELLRGALSAELSSGNATAAMPPHLGWCCARGQLHPGCELSQCWTLCLGACAATGLQFS